MTISDCCHQELAFEEDIEGKQTPVQECPKCGNFCGAKFVSCFGSYMSGKEYCTKVCKYAKECQLKTK